MRRRAVWAVAHTRQNLPATPLLKKQLSCLKEMGIKTVLI